MSEEDPLASGRSARDEALQRLTGRYGKLKAGLEERGIGQRLADEAMYRARDVSREAIEIANDSKGVIAATAGALLLWLFRKPLSRGVQGLLPRLKAWRNKEDESE